MSDSLGARLVFLATFGGFKPTDPRLIVFAVNGMLADSNDRRTSMAIVYSIVGSRIDSRACRLIVPPNRGESRFV